MERLQKRIKNAPEGRLRTSKTRKSVRAYYVNGPENNDGSYLNKKQDDLKRALAQKEYDENLLSILDKEYKNLSKFIAFYNFHKWENAYLKLHPNKRPLVNPVWPPDNVLIEK